MTFKDDKVGEVAGEAPLAQQQKTEQLPSPQFRLSRSPSSAVAWTVATTALLAVAGFWPTNAMAGQAGLWGMLTAGLIVAAVGSVAISIVSAMAARGAGLFALSFILAGMVKAMVLAGLGLAAGLLLPVSAGALSLWLCVFYVAVLGVQISWIVKVLRHDGR